MGFFQDLFTNKDASNAANSKIGGLQAGYEQASGLFGQGRDALSTNYAAALQPFQQLYGQSQQGLNAYGNAMGLNGQAGSTAATQAFQNTPGYQFAFNQGLQGIDRGAASRGMLTSGNTLGAEQQYGTGLADQTYQSYVKNLQPYFQQGSQAATGIGTIDTGLGNALNTSYGNQGNLAFQTQTGIGNAKAGADLANQSAANNIFGAVSSGINLGSKLLGFA